MPVHIDRNALHRLLWGRADRFGRYRMELKALCDELGLSYAHFSVVIREMAAEGRMRRIAGPKYGQKVYQVENPAGWMEKVG